MIELALMIMAVAFAVLVGYLVPTVIQLRRTVSQSERLLARLNNDVPLLLKELRGTSEQVHAMTTQAKQGVDRISVLMNAIGDVGKTVNQVHGVIRGRGGAILMGLASAFAGMKAASSTISQRVQTKGGKQHGG
ncbi:MAG: DUF948 domain-containing protein [Nitrospirales bacterium]|nr:DUF948 domain-containing protein [Nitrospirales bacterium]